MNLEPMWEALEKYQPYADKHGFGEVWLRMTTERTVEAIEGARDAAWGVSWKVLDARAAAMEAMAAVKRANKAVEYINKAIEQENEHEP